jgi:inositol oxygenase
MNEKDIQSLVAVQAFNPYDLYSKRDNPCNVGKLRPYYQNLLSKFFPPTLDW